MKQLFIKVLSNNKKTFNPLTINPVQKLKAVSLLNHKHTIHKVSSKILVRKITLLKSPHVHKNAQTSFESILYKKNFRIESYQFYKILNYYAILYSKNILDYRVFLKLRLNAEKLYIKSYMFKMGTQISLPLYLSSLGIYGKKSL